MSYLKCACCGKKKRCKVYAHPSKPYSEAVCKDCIEHWGKQAKGTRKAKKKPVFSKKEWGLIFDRVISMLLVSMVTQALKKGAPVTFGGQPIKEANFLLPKGKTKNPAYDRTRKGEIRRKS